MHSSEMNLHDTCGLKLIISCSLVEELVEAEPLVEEEEDEPSEDKKVTATELTNKIRQVKQCIVQYSVPTSQYYVLKPVSYPANVGA
jgi:hypothetical protein